MSGRYILVLVFTPRVTYRQLWVGLRHGGKDGENRSWTDGSPVGYDGGGYIGTETEMGKCGKIIYSDLNSLRRLHWAKEKCRVSLDFICKRPMRE